MILTGKHTNNCLEWLEEAFAECELCLGSSIVFPGYEAMHDQAKFKRLVTTWDFRFVKFAHAITKQ